MQCTALFFAHMAEAAQMRQATLDLPSGATVKDVLDRLCDQHPGIVGLRPGLSIAVNESYVSSHDTVLADGDVIALIPPVSGG